MVKVTSHSVSLYIVTPLTCLILWPLPASTLTSLFWTLALLLSAQSKLPVLRVPSLDACLGPPLTHISISTSFTIAFMLMSPQAAFQITSWISIFVCLPGSTHTPAYSWQSWPHICRHHWSQGHTWLFSGASPQAWAYVLIITPFLLPLSTMF